MDYRLNFLVMAFDVTIKKDGKFCVLSMKGQIDQSCNEKLQKTLYESLDKKILFVILDLSMVSFISSNGIGAIVESKAFIESFQGRFILSGLNSKIANIFNLIGLMNEVEYFKTYEDAVEKLQMVQAG